MKEKKSSIVFQDEKRYDDLNTNDKDFINKALEQGMTRREALTWLMAAGFTVATAGSIFTSAKDVMAATPKKGGWFVKQTSHRLRSIHKMWPYKT